MPFPTEPTVQTVPGEGVDVFFPINADHGEYLLVTVTKYGLALNAYNSVEHVGSKRMTAAELFDTLGERVVAS